MEAENQIDLIYSEASDHDTECYQVMHGSRIPALALVAEE